MTLKPGVTRVRSVPCECARILRASMVRLLDDRFARSRSRFRKQLVDGDPDWIAAALARKVTGPASNHSDVLYPLQGRGWDFPHPHRLSSPIDCLLARKDWKRPLVSPQAVRTLSIKALSSNSGLQCLVRLTWFCLWVPATRSAPSREVWPDCPVLLGDR